MVFDKNVETTTSKLINLLSIRHDKLLTLAEITNLQNGDIVFVQWPCEEAASPYQIRTKTFNGYERPWVYATDIHPYKENLCFWDREISGYGKYTPGKDPYDMRVWIKSVPEDPEPEEGYEIFTTILWN